MSLINFLTPEDLFHPKVYYEGEWLLGGELVPNSSEIDYLLLNAKTVNGKNAYQEFLERHYYQPLSNMLGSKSLVSSFFPKIALSEKDGKRVVCFSMSTFLYQQLLGLYALNEEKQEFLKFQETLSTIDSENGLIPYIKEELRKDRKIYSDIQQNRTKSPNYGNVYQLYLDYIRYSQSMMSFDEFLNGKISGITKLLVASKYYPELFQKELPIDELMAAFDYDTFCLVAARSSLDSCKTTEQRENLVDNSVSYVRLYLDAVERVRQEQPDYDCAMRLIDNSGKMRKLRIQDIQKEYESLLARHPEFSFIMISNREASNLLRKEGMEEIASEDFDFSTKDNHAILEVILKRLKEDRELSAEWEFIRKGSNESESSIHYPALYPTQALSEDEKVRRMLIGREYLENSDYVYKIYGIHKFEGYVGYIYPNGSVIFEKYYENIKTKKVASSSATYVMRLDNFMEMSKLSKTEIIRIIHRDSSANVKRIFHREDMERWKSDIFRTISGSDYTEEVMNYINTLISHNNLKKSEVKS